MDFKPVQKGSSEDPFDSKNGLISQVRCRQRSTSIIKMIIVKMIIVKMIIVNHQNNHHQVNDYLTGLSYQINLDLGNCSISTIEVQSPCCLGLCLTHIVNQETGGMGNNVVANGRLHMQK